MAPEDRGPRRLGRRARVLALGAAALALVALAGAPALRGLLTRADPVDLVGMWRVSDSPEGLETWLRLGDDGPGGAMPTFHLIRDCGPVSGTWAADARSLRAQVSSSSAGCAGRGDDHAPTDLGVPWLTAVTSYTRSGDGWELRDVDGRRVARLLPFGRPVAVDGYPDAGTVPEVTPELRSALSAPAPLPAGLTPATAASLRGRWVPEGTFATDPGVDFGADGRWEASDGCNGIAGFWWLGRDGHLLRTSTTGMTLMGCDGAGVPGWVVAAARTGIRDDRLVLLDRDAQEIAELVRP